MAEKITFRIDGVGPFDGELTPTTGDAYDLNFQNLRADASIFEGVGNVLIHREGDFDLHCAMTGASFDMTPDRSCISGKINLKHR